MDLNDIRNEIDSIDQNLVELLLTRMNCSLKVAEIKKSLGLPVYHPKREQEILNKVSAMGGNYGTHISEIYSLIMQCSRELQLSDICPESEIEKIVLSAETELSVSGKVACYGEEGAFTQIALNGAFGQKAEPIFSKTFEGVFEKVISGEVEYGFLPVENSSAGSVNEVYDLILKYKLFIAGSVSMPIIHNLLGINGASLEDIKTVYSHGQAISQCKTFLEKENISAVEYFNTAAAAKYVAELGDKTIAAIGSAECAKQNNLNVLCSSIQAFKNNKTRFIVLSKKPVIAKDSNKISVVFPLANTPGSLQKLLTRFSIHGLNLTKLESRAGKNGDFETQFYLDFLGCVENKDTLSLLSALNSELNDFSFLGNYKEINL